MAVYRCNNYLCPMFSRIEFLFDHVQVYEKPDLQAKALQVIPLNHLRQKAESWLVREAKEHGTSLQECFLLEMMSWFKLFFAFCGKPTCDNCKAAPDKMVEAGRATPTAEEQRWDPVSIVLYAVKKSARPQLAFLSTTIRKAPQNAPWSIYGERANCFAACCRAVSLEVRLDGTYMYVA